FLDQQEFITKLQVLKNASRVWLNRNPTEDEINTVGGAFDSKTNADIIKGVVNSPAAAAVINNADFLRMLFMQTLKSLNFTQTLYTNLLNGLNNSTITRWDAILQILDSSQFAGVVPSVDDYNNYLIKYQRYFPSTFAGSRSANWVTALNAKS